MKFELISRPDETSTYIPTNPVSPIILFLLFAIGVGILWLSESQHIQPPIKGILEHFASAVIVAGVLGVSYEFLVHKYRAQTLTKLLENQRNKLYEALNVFMLTTPKEVFGLLQEIAEQTKSTPTLYTPAREKTDSNNDVGEYTFSKSADFFDVLVEVRRIEIVNVLREWIKPEKSANLRFLGSDFIGKYQLSELAEDLCKMALKDFDKWESLKSNEKNRNLNFMWAASRCELTKYNWLTTLLLNTESKDIQEWILFIPQQMPEDKEFLDIIRRYLREKKDKILNEINKPDNNTKDNNDTYDKCILTIGESLASLERQYNSEGKRIVSDYEEIFSNKRYKDKISIRWTDLGFPLNESSQTKPKILDKIRKIIK